jgi:phosphate transport system protein
MMTDHTVKAFDKDLAELGAKIAEMGGLTEKMLTDAIDALLRLDLDLARATIATDPRVDALEREVEERAVLTLARRQPMGIDLREIVAAMRIASDLERVGDLAKNIAKRTLILQQEQRMPRALVGLRHMGQLAALQLKDVLDAYAQRDLERAKGVWNRDAEIDALDDSIFRELLTFMMEDPRNISPCTHLLFCSKNVERVGDHTTNIAETVHYIVTGTSLPVERPKG